MVQSYFVPDQMGGHWEVYIESELFAVVPDSELSETLKEAREKLYCEL